MMITWTREEVKTRAKAALHMYYWKMVLVGVILSVMLGGGAGSSSSVRNNNQQTSSSNPYSSFQDAFRGSRFDPNVKNTPGEYDFAFVSMLFKIMLIATIISILFRIFLLNPMIAGCRGFYNRIYEEDPEISVVLSVLKENYWNGVKTCFLRDLYISLWSLLFVIPGIIKAYQYRMVPYILAENPDKDTTEILQESKDMMEGHKMSTFVLDLSFLGWIFLGAITIGLVWTFWTAPYMYATEGALYRKLSNADYRQSGMGNNGYPGGMPNPYPGSTQGPNAVNGQNPYASGQPNPYPGSTQGPNAVNGQNPYNGGSQNPDQAFQNPSSNLPGQGGQSQSESLQGQFDRNYFSEK